MDQYRIRPPRRILIPIILAQPEVAFVRAVTWTSTWEVPAPTDVVGSAIEDRLRTLRFKVEVIRDGSLRARRSTSWSIAWTGRSSPQPKVLDPTNLPVVAEAVWRAAGDRTTLTLVLTDAEPIFISSESLLATYSDGFRYVDDEIGASLVDLGATRETQGTIRPSEERRSGYGKRVLGLADSVGSSVSGGRWRQRSNLRLANGDRYASVDNATSTMMLAVAEMAKGDDSMPDTLRQRLIRLVSALADRADGTAGERTLEIADADLELWRFIHRQAMLRSGLPARERHRCTDCGTEKIVNPQYQKEQARTQRFSNVAQVVSSTSVYGPLSALGVGARVVSVHLQHRSFLCPKCQGTDAEVSVCTICPSCGAMCDDPVLRRCEAPHCGYSYSARQTPELEWSSSGSSE